MNTKGPLPPRAPRPTRRTARSVAPQASKSPASLRVVAGLVVLALVAGAFGLLSARCTSPNDVASPTGYVSPYDWSGLERSGDRLAYYEDGELRSRLGVDVSDHQGAVDWNAVASDGVEFAMVRVGNRGYTEGVLYADDRYAENIEGATDAGLDVGAYFFSQAVSVEEAREEAEFVLNLLAGRHLALPVVYDHEPVSDAAGRANNLDRDTLTACARAFCERIEQGGYSTMIYGNSGDMARYDRADLGDRPVWFAEYDAAQPHAQFDFTMWQYTNGGTVAGIDTNVDLNLLLDTK
ncbi:glycoside hydrolase [Gordonibacter sp. 28C]|uniref:glycoside hydrolase family 25 protein n=1 Tax=Gordonibacter sp. 28C TaxID=2078569 RepID=UPI000DF75291|nr:glycoside hydrolase family 25 protein [Gordonibacter sp. 28C]RDB61621.1 glycoside hydrolase [Gordonibacter sp. 28C]